MRGLWCKVEDRALEVDHIVPRNKGGSNERSNLQALCYKCNAGKRDRDQTDFAAVQASYKVWQEGCAFCELPQDRVVGSHELAYAVRDRYPVTDGHTLVIPKRHVADYFDLYQPERNAIEQLLHECQQKLRTLDASINGFNIGANSGQSAGQTIFHVHVHLIPRRTGDVENPRGGVRGVIPERQDYVAG